MSTTTSVVIPAYGRSDLLEQCLRGIPTSLPVSVIDDCTPDKDETARLKSITMEYGGHYFRRPSNKGFAVTVNFGISKTRTDLVLLLNTDVILQPNAFDVLYNEMRDENVAIAGPMLIFPPNSEWGTPECIQHVGMAVDVLGNLRHLFIGWSTTNKRAVQRRDNLNYATGACMLLRRSVWSKLGGFSEAYGRGTYEDAELCIRARRELKMKIVVNPEAQGVHYVGQSGKHAGGFPLRQNLEIFKLRCGHLVQNDDFLFL